MCHQPHDSGLVWEDFLEDGAPGLQQAETCQEARTKARDLIAHSRFRGHEAQQLLQEDRAGKGWKGDKGPHY